ncbi:ATP-binding protein [Actinomadura kijaniata]|uniref:ATP-binding protein n=1 Tax=Actinomadura kijaniata TaxID=46161 RepID=UPI003F1E1BEB
MDGSWRPHGGLPPEPSTFVGRERELRRVRDALAAARLVTLTGPGGVGKTRVALRAARDAAAAFPDGVRLVELSGLRDPGLLAGAVAASLGVRDGMAHVPVGLLAGGLRDRRLLLVLDTCEHLVGAAADLVRALLAGCPELRVLATSRQPLDVLGERVLPVPPLAVPVSGPASGDNGPAGGGDAVALFAARAAEAVPGFAVTRANRADVELLCRRLDGIPLAIELAAVRLRTLSLEQLMRRLDLLFWTLGDGPSEEARHQTLRTTVGWSHELCAPHERLLWARLSVFAGGFDLTMAEEVCADDRLDRVSVVARLVGLVDKSIVQRSGPGRYAMLDTVREYGAAWLEMVEDARPLRRRHRDCVLRLAEAAAGRWLTGDYLDWVRRLEAERDNVRAALDHSLSVPGERATGVRLLNALWHVWIGRSRFAEGCHWMDRALAVTGETTPGRVGLLWRNAVFRLCQGDREAAHALLAEGLKLAERADDRPGYARVQRTLGMAATFLGDRAGADRAFAEALPVFEAAGLTRDLVLHRLLRAFLHIRDGEPGPGVAECAAGLALLADQPGEPWARGWFSYLNALAHWFAGDVESCAAHLMPALEMFHRMRDPVGVTHCFEVMGWVLARRRRYAEGAILLGAASRYPARTGVPHLGDRALAAQHRRLEEQARAALGAEAFERHHRRGRTLTPEETVRFAHRGGFGADDRYRA